MSLNRSIFIVEPVQIEGGKVFSRIERIEEVVCKSGGRGAVRCEGGGALRTE